MDCRNLKSGIVRPSIWKFGGWECLPVASSCYRYPWLMVTMATDIVFGIALRMERKPGKELALGLALPGTGVGIGVLVWTLAFGGDLHPIETTTRPKPHDENK